MDQVTTTATTSQQTKSTRPRRQRRTERRRSKKNDLLKSFEQGASSMDPTSIDSPADTSDFFNLKKELLLPIQIQTSSSTSLHSIFATPPESPIESPSTEAKDSDSCLFSRPTAFTFTSEGSTGFDSPLSSGTSASTSGSTTTSSTTIPPFILPADYIPLDGEELKKIERAESLPIGSDGDIVPLPQESEQGNVEYKWKLVGKGPERIRNLITQMNYRLTEGLGEAIYQLGVLDNGYPAGLSDQELLESINTIKGMAQHLRCECIVLRVAKGKEGKIAEVLVRRTSDSDFIDIRVCVIGNVESGKSTLVGVLTSGRLDDGKGLARMNVFRHRHEVENGRTSSISKQILGFDSEGNVTNNTSSFQSGWAEIMEDSSKVLTFLDLAGHEAYLKTTVMGLMGLSPDYGLVVVTADGGVSGMMKEHLGVSLALHIPIFVVITKIDFAPPTELQQTIKRLTDILTSSAAKKQVVVVDANAEVMEDQITEYAKNLTKVCPIFPISAVTGVGLQALKLFLFNLPKQKDWSKFASQPCQSTIDDHYTVTGVGTVVGGTVTHGVIKAGESLLLGPDAQGAFKPVTVKSVHVKRSPAKQATTGQAACFALKQVKRVDLRKGMVLMHPSLNPRACVGFEAKIRVLYHPNKINTKSKYEPIIHVGNVRQAAILQSRPSQPEMMGTGDRARVIFHFCHRPEYIPLKSRFIFAEGRTRGVGTVQSLIYVDADEAKEILDNMAIRKSGRSPARKGSSSNLLPTFSALTPPQSSSSSSSDENRMDDMNDPEMDSSSTITHSRRSRSNENLSTPNKPLVPLLPSRTQSNDEMKRNSPTTPTTPASRNGKSKSKSRSPPQRISPPPPRSSSKKKTSKNEETSKSMFRTEEPHLNGSASMSPIFKSSNSITATTTTEISLNTSLGFGHDPQQGSLFNLSLATIFSTRIEDDTEQKPCHDNDKDVEDDDDEDDGYDDDHPMVSSTPGPFTPIAEEKEKPQKRAHPIPFTSPSYLKSLERSKNRQQRQPPPPPPPTSIPKKHNRKRTRSKKKTDVDEMASVRRKSEYRTDRKEKRKEGDSN